MKYNLIDRAAERELAPGLRAVRLSIIPYAPLHGGLLADLGVLDREVSGDQRFGAAGFTDAEIAVAREVDRLSREWGLAPYQVSLAWLLSRPAVASVDRRRRDRRRAPRQRHRSRRRLSRRSSTPSPPWPPSRRAFHHRAGDGPAASRRHGSSTAVARAHGLTRKEPAMPRADQSTIDLLTDYFAAMEAKDFDTPRRLTTPTTSP